VLLTQEFLDLDVRIVGKVIVSHVSQARPLTERLAIWRFGSASKPGVEYVITAGEAGHHDSPRWRPRILVTNRSRDDSRETRSRMRWRVFSAQPAFSAAFIVCE
jgi:hypothetical protein